MKRKFNSFNICGKSVAGVGISFPPPLPGSPHAHSLPTMGGSEKGDRGGPKEERKRKRRRPLFSLCWSFLDHERGGERGEVRPSAILLPPSANGQEKKGLLLLFLLLLFFPSPIPSIPPFPTRNHAGASDRVLLWMPPSPSSCFSFPFSPRGLIARGEVYRRNAFLCIHIYHLT